MKSPPALKIPRMPKLPKMPTKPGQGGGSADDPTIEEMVGGLQEDILTEGQAYFQEARHKESARFELNTDSEYWACLVFETREQKEKFMAHFNAVKIAGGDKYLNGVAMARALGVDMGPPTKWAAVRRTPKQLLELVGKR
jgi:hypothetical protein